LQVLESRKNNIFADLIVLTNIGAAELFCCFLKKAFFCGRFVTRLWDMALILLSDFGERL
jgi:hypothetical protein